MYNWRHQISIRSINTIKQYLDYLIDPSFEGVNIFFALSFENNAVRTGYTEYFLPKVKIKDYNVMISGRNLFDQSIRNGIKHMKALEKLLLIKEMITQFLVY